MHKLHFVIAGLVCVLLAPHALAQTARPGGAPNTQLIQQLQQLGSERTELQAENARLKRELETVRKERDSAQAAEDSLSRRVQSAAAELTRSTQARESTESELTQLRERTQELIAKFRETAQTLRDVETERASLKQVLASQEQQFKACATNNLELYKLNDEILTRLDGQGVWSRVAQAEPFTRLKRVQLENLVEDYKYRADEQRIVVPGAAASSVPQAHVDSANSP